MVKRSGQDKERKQSRLNMLARLVAGGALGVALLLKAPGVDEFGVACLYVASWIILLHVGIGEYVFIRYLHALSRNQQALDALAFVLMLCALLSVENPALWCAFFAGVFSLAIVKYLLVESRTPIENLRRYAREKVRLETPSVLLFAALAVLFNHLPPGHFAARSAALAILAAAAGFAFWMIGVRHVYRRLARGPNRAE